MYRTLLNRSLFVLAMIALVSSAMNASATEKKGAKKDEEGLFKAAKLNFPETEPVMGFVDSRNNVSLNGNWHIIVDPMGAGTPGGFMNYTSGVRNVDGMTLVEYDFEKSDQIRVPGDFNTQSERLFFYQGWVWYYKKITKLK